MLVLSFVNLGMTLDSIASCFLHVLLLETRLSISFQNVGGLNLCIWCCRCCCCRRVFVVVTVDRVLIFVGDGHGISQADSRLQCRKIMFARVVCLLVVGRTIRWICPAQEVHAFHGVDDFVSLLYFCSVSLFVTASRGW